MTCIYKPGSVAFSHLDGIASGLTSHRKRLYIIIIIFILAIFTYKGIVNQLTLFCNQPYKLITVHLIDNWIIKDCSCHKSWSMRHLVGRPKASCLLTSQTFIVDNHSFLVLCAHLWQTPTSSVAYSIILYTYSSLTGGLPI